MDFVRVTRDALGQETVAGVAWDLLPAALGLGVVVIVGHRVWRARKKPPLAVPGTALVTRHALLDRIFHWLMALAVLVLMFTAFLPVAGVRFHWVPAHWMAGLTLTALIVFHTLRASFVHRLRCMVVRPRDVSDARAGRGAAKYTLGHKLMHAVLGIAVLVATVTGLLLLARLQTPLWNRNLDLLSTEGWGVVCVLHGAAALVTLTLTMLHVYFSVLPEKRGYLRAMIFGQMTREEAALYHDPARWAGNRKSDPK